MEKVNILGVDIENTTLEEAKSKALSFLNGEGLHTVYTPNSEIVMEAQKDEKLKSILNDGDLVVPDGIGLVHASKIKKKPLKERVTGFDLSMEILDLANSYGYRIYLLGGAEGVAQKAKEELERQYPNIKVVGLHNGYFKGYHIGHENSPEEEAIIEEINSLETDVLFVGFGAPKQEYWIDHNKDKLKAKLVIGNGGTMDVIAGKVKRAPEIYQKLGLEWLYRLAKEPTRIKRQISLPIFLLTILTKKDSVR